MGGQEARKARDERQLSNERQRHWQMGGGNMRRGYSTTSQTKSMTGKRGNSATRDNGLT
jgi:hypothetical protein